MKFRFLFLFLIFTSLYGLLIFKLYTIQVLKGDLYIARAESQLASGNLRAARGSIYFTDKDGNFIPAALEKSFYEIFADPTKISDPAITAVELASIVNLTTDELIKFFNKSNSQYELLVKKATPEQITAINNLDTLDGIYVNKKSSRFYPLESLSSHLLGYVSENNNTGHLIGQYGLEKQYEDRLAGIDGTTEGDKLTNPIAGGDVYLTIDRNIQSQAEDILFNLVEKYKAKGGSVIVQNPKTGRILALANAPNFNPNNYSDYPISNFINPAIQNIYEPGSIFKVITMAIGLDSGSFTPETTYYDSGSVSMNGYTIHNWDLKGYGTQTMTNVIEKSLNTGTVFAEKQIGHGTFRNYLENFNLNNTTGIALPGEVSGSIMSLIDNPRDINFATASFGQGISVTPINLISVISTIANNGTMMKPIIEANAQPQMVADVISPKSAHQVINMMVSAVDGAVLAAIPGYTVAGKTGTAQVPDFKNGGYTKDVINTYSGFAPASDPQFTILIKLDQPAGAPLAGHTVVPAFKNLAQFILNYYHIPPDRF